MPISQHTLRRSTGLALAIVTLVTRLPFHARTLFEFDSVDFAVATYRFNVLQVTPHVPGDILHVYLARLFALFTPDINAAYVWLATALSIGSVLCLWRAVALIRGERVALIAAILWLTTPAFWVLGGVATVYPEEAFFSALLLYIAMKWVQNPTSNKLPLLLSLATSLAIAARQNDVLFFTPAIIYLFCSLKPFKALVWQSIVLFAVVTAAWAIDILVESGGLPNYLAAFAAQPTFRGQSILFGNGWSGQLNVTGRFLFYLPLAIGPAILLLVVGIVVRSRRMGAIVKKARQSTRGRFMLLLTLPAFCFYLLIYFMKVGYILVFLPIIIAGLAILLDEFAIALAKRRKERQGNQLITTRPLITRYAIILTATLTIANILWFTLPMPGTDITSTFDENTRDSFFSGAQARVATSHGVLLTFANRAFAYTNYRPTVGIDKLNQTTLQALHSVHANSSSTVIFATWWTRKAFFYMPNAYVFDIAPTKPASIVGLSHEQYRTAILSRVVDVPPHKQLLIMMRHDDPLWKSIDKQFQLQRLPTPQFLDIYRATPRSDTVQWSDVRFIFR